MTQTTSATHNIASIPTDARCISCLGWGARIKTDGNLVQERDIVPIARYIVKKSFSDYMTVMCIECQNTGLKAIPIEEVITL